MNVCSVLFLSCLYICICVCLQIQVPLRECRSIQSGVCGPPYYCAPLVCVPAVIQVLAVWWHYKPKTKNQFQRDMSASGDMAAKRAKLPTALQDKPPISWDLDDVSTWVLSWGPVFPGPALCRQWCRRINNHRG